MSGFVCYQLIYRACLFVTWGVVGQDPNPTAPAPGHPGQLGLEPPNRLGVLRDPTDRHESTASWRATGMWRGSPTQRAVSAGVSLRRHAHAAAQCVQPNRLVIANLVDLTTGAASTTPHRFGPAAAPQFPEEGRGGGSGGGFPFPFPLPSAVPFPFPCCLLAPPTPAPPLPPPLPPTAASSAASSAAAHRVYAIM